MRHRYRSGGLGLLLSLCAADPSLAQNYGFPVGPQGCTNTCGDSQGYYEDVWANEPRIKDIEYTGNAAPGSILVSHKNLKAYIVLPNGKAKQMVVSLGREGKAMPAGIYKISHRVIYPSWTPTAEHRRDDPSLPRVVSGGDDNPLGYMAFYITDAQGTPTLYRLHGTNEPSLLGEYVSSGCIRAHNGNIKKASQLIKDGATMEVHLGDVPGIGPVIAKASAPKAP